MARPFTDIARIDDNLPIKNGTLIVSSTKTGSYSTYNRYVLNTPVIEDIASKYGNRFYNGIFVTLTGDQTIIGG